MNNWIILDRQQYIYIRRLDPHNTVWDLNTPMTTSGVTKHEATTTETIHNYILKGDLARKRMKEGGK